MERAGFYRTLHGTPPPSDKPRCVVCGDESSGIHYGVNSCEGCKGFFRRCMVKGMHQKCTNNEECEITRFARNSCQFCRLKKCVRVGMSRSASKVGRRPKTTSVLATEVTAAAESAKNKPSGPRRSQSLIGPGKSTPGSPGLRDLPPVAQNSPGVSRRSSTSSGMYERVRSCLEGLRTTSNTSPFVTPYPTPCSSRTPSISGVDTSSWPETDESSTEQATNVIDYSVGANYQSFGYDQRSPVYGNTLNRDSTGNNNNGNGAQYDHHPSTSGVPFIHTTSERNWMNPHLEAVQGGNLQAAQPSFAGTLSSKISPTESPGSLRHYDPPSMQQSGTAPVWQPNPYQSTLNATSIASYYKDFYPNGPQ